MSIYGNLTFIESSLEFVHTLAATTVVLKSDGKTSASLALFFSQTLWLYFI